MSVDTKEVSHPVLTFDTDWKIVKCHGCFHRGMFWSTALFSLFLSSPPTSSETNMHTILFPTVPFFPSASAYSILTGACVCLGMEMLPESLCLAARADPPQPSCEYVYMDFTEESPDGYFCILLSPSKKKQKKGRTWLWWHLHLELSELHFKPIVAFGTHT